MKGICHLRLPLPDWIVGLFTDDEHKSVSSLFAWGHTEALCLPVNDLSYYEEKVEVKRK